VTATKLKIIASPAKSEVVRVLRENGLPSKDISGQNLEHFFSLSEKSKMLGVIGLEIHGADALLRSLAVSPGAQGKGCGLTLLQHLEAYSREKGIVTLYLLTETARGFFKKYGYESIDREVAPPSIRRTSQFSSICPKSATLMRKNIQL